MALHTLEELHDKTADQIRALIEEGYRIDPNRTVTDPKVFYAKLVKVTDTGLRFEVTFSTVEGANTFTKSAVFNSTFIHKEDWKY